MRITQREAETIHGRTDKAHEAGGKASDLVRELGFAQQRYYRWKNKYGGMEVSESKQLREQESENVRVKKLLAENELDKAMLHDVIKKVVKPGSWRRFVGSLQTLSGISQR
jgi:putative transposase